MQILPIDETVKIPSLVELCLQGNREAFREIVERHQSMVCALAYSICGDLGRSEELAQDTFVIAWQKLAELKNPADLKAWLCGIVRNLSYNSLRLQRRTPTARAEPLSRETDIGITTPHEQAITKEEEALMWRALHEIPKAYREPMILFYREDQSAATVAAVLGLSEDAVRQRLSRGRTLLSERLARTVVDTLRRSAPTKVFTLAVVAALPAMGATPAKAATAGTIVAKATGTGKTASLLTSLGGSLAATLGGFYFFSKAEVENSRTPGERRFKVGLVRCRLALIVLFGLSAPFLYDWVGVPGLCALGVFCTNLLRVLTAFRWQAVQHRGDAEINTEAALINRPRRSLIAVFRSGSRAEIHAACATILLVTIFGTAAAGSEPPMRWVLLVGTLYLAARLLFRGVGGWLESQRYDAHAAALLSRTGQGAAACLTIYNVFPLMGVASPMHPAYWNVGFNACIILAYAVLAGLIFWKQQPE